MKPEKGAHVGMYLGLEGKVGKNPESIEEVYFKMGKKSTRVAAGVPDSIVKLPARSADEKSGEQFDFLWAVSLPRVTKRSSTEVIL